MPGISFEMRWPIDAEGSDRVAEDTNRTNKPMTTSSAETTEQTYTVEEYERLPEDDGYRDELVRGRLVREPGPGNEHGMVQANLTAELHRHMREHDLGVVRVETGYVLSTEPATVRCPDVSFIARDRIPPEGLPRGFPRIPPDLAVEVVSPSNTAADVQEKVEEYFGAGVRQVWIVYPRTRKVAVHLSPAEVQVFGNAEELEGGELIPGLRLPVAKLFED